MFVDRDLDCRQNRLFFKKKKFLITPAFKSYSLIFVVVVVAGIDFKIKTIELQGKKIKLQIWLVFVSTLIE